MLLDYLRKELRLRQRRNKSYSVRAFARALGVDASTLSKILAGRRKLTFPMAKKITGSLKIDDAVKNILLLTYADTGRKFFVDEDYHVPDSKRSAELMSKWEYYTVLSYVEVDDRDNPKKIAVAIGTSEETVQAILGNLSELGILKREGGRIILTGLNLTAPADFDRGSLLKVHREHIEKALEFLGGGDLTGGDVSGITIAISAKRFAEAKERIRDFRRSLGEFLNNPEDTEDAVYRLNIQFFSLTRPAQKKR